MKKSVLSYITSFSKALTVVWMVVWVETILFSQFATLFNFGDAMSIQYIINTVTEIGMIIAGFYFGSKTIENVAKGIEVHHLEVLDRKSAGLDNSDSDVTPVE